MNVCIIYFFLFSDEHGEKSKSTTNKKRKRTLCGTCQGYVPIMKDLMIACDDCGQWYHYQCVGVMADEAAEIDFVCPQGDIWFQYIMQCFSASVLQYFSASVFQCISASVH